MKPLHYAALADASYAADLSRQVHESLRPFVAYLNAAKRAAKAREARSWCGWEAVPLEHPLKLEPLDSLVELVVEGHCYRAIGWQGPLPDMPLFVGATFRPVDPLRVEPGPDAPLLVLQDELSSGEAIYWAGQRCNLQAVQPAAPDWISALRADGTNAPIRHRFELQGRLRVVVEGREAVTLTSAAGATLAHRVLSAEDGASVLRTRKTSLPWNGERFLALKTQPDEPTLTADNAVRWSWSSVESRGRRKRGVWIQLLPAEGGDSDATVDPRAAYCEEGVRSVRTEKRLEIKVYGFRRDSYRLELESLPPAGTQLFLPANLSGLNRQLDAVHRLKDGPLPHHRGLLTLCEAPAKARWPAVKQASISDWLVLKDEQWEGTTEQRKFVARALGTEDFAFLEGPPGSGKTHAICELVLQLVARNQRVLLCSTTHVAVDNVLERLAGTFPQVEAIRIGKTDKIDPRVQDCQFEMRVDRLASLWEAHPSFAGVAIGELDAMASATVLASANLTCGTTTGILRHPYLSRQEDGVTPSWPHFDVLILDEASKTTFQEFLVPAQLAKRWVIVGDVRQLPPFTEPRDLEASLAELSDDDPARGPGERRRLPDAYQRACLLFARLELREAGQGRARWLLDEPMAVLDALAAEVSARREGDGGDGPMVVRIVQRKALDLDLTPDEIRTGELAALKLLASHWVFVQSELLSEIERFLPAELIRLRDADDLRAYSFRHHHWAAQQGRFNPPIQARRGPVRRTVSELVEAERTFFREESWAKQVAWRLGRVHQLGNAKDDHDRAARLEEIERLLPIAPRMEWVAPAVDAIRDVGVRSVIEALRVPRTDHRVRRRSALTDAIPPHAWDERSLLLTRQHRMHPDISALPSRLFYGGTALLDANTLNGRDAKVGWSFLTDQPARRVWVDVVGHEDRGANPEEVEAMRGVLERWKAWSANSPRKDGRPWEVACLSFYNKQELAIRDMLRTVTGQRSHETRFELPHSRLACATVDRFQGREADLVLLSFRNVKRAGHADSPNRLNVAITRGRFQLLLFGNKRYFEHECHSEELAELAAKTPLSRGLSGR